MITSLKEGLEDFEKDQQNARQLHEGLIHRIKKNEPVLMQGEEADKESSVISEIYNVMHVGITKMDEDPGLTRQRILEKCQESSQDKNQFYQCIT